MTREQREDQLKQTALQSDGIARLCDLYRSLTHRLPAVNISSRQLIAEILALEFDDVLSLDNL